MSGYCKDDMSTVVRRSRFAKLRALNEYACALNEVLIAFLSVTHRQIYAS